MDTPDLGVEFCPGCNPQDVFEHLDGGRVWSIRWHERCLPSIRGEEDSLSAHPEVYLGGAGDCGVSVSQAIHALIR